MRVVARRSTTLLGAGSARLRLIRWYPGGGAIARLVVVHGLGEHAGRYAETAEALARAGIEVWAYDQRGHGESEGRRGTMHRFEDLLEDLDHVWSAAGREGDRLPRHLLGHSLGGLVALRWLQSRTGGGVVPTSAVLSAPWLAHAFEIPVWQRVARHLLRQLAPSLTLASGLDVEGLTHDRERRRMYVQDPLVHDRVSARLMDEIEGAQALALERGVDPGTPLLVLVPLDDPVAAPAITLDWAKSLPGDAARVEGLEGFLHEPFQEVDRERVQRLVGEWVRQNSASGAG